MESLYLIYLSVVRDRWRVVLRMVLKICHLRNCQLLERKSTPWNYTKRPRENRCATWRHTQHVPEHVGGRQGHTERLQQCLLVSKQGSFSDILQEQYRSSPFQDWGSATWVLKAVLSSDRLHAHKALFYSPWHESWTSVGPVLGAALRSGRWQRVLKQSTCRTDRRGVGVQEG